MNLGHEEDVDNAEIGGTRIQDGGPQFDIHTQGCVDALLTSHRIAA